MKTTASHHKITAFVDGLVTVPHAVGHVDNRAGFRASVPLANSSPLRVTSR